MTDDQPVLVGNDLLERCRTAARLRSCVVAQSRELTELRDAFIYLDLALVSGAQIPDDWCRNRERKLAKGAAYEGRLALGKGGA